MSKIRIAAMAATMLMVIPALAQDTTTTQTTTVQETTTTQTAPPSTVQQDEMRARQQQAEIVGNPDVHWTIKERTELLMNAPYLRPRDMWEISHMFRMLPANEERIMFDALTNAIRANAGDFFERRAAVEQYWQTRYTTTRTNAAGGVTTTTTTTTTAPADTMATRPQVMVGAGNAIGAGMSAMEAWDLMLRDLDADDRTTFRTVWETLTSGQRDALINIVRQSRAYYVWRGGYYMMPR